MDENWVVGLVADGEPESQVLDFKGRPPARDDTGIRSLLVDVAGFANARGGRIVYGVKEDGQGRAEKLVDVDGNADSLSLWMQTHLLGKIYPRINGLVVQAIHTANGTVIVIDVPAQYGGPYMATHAEWQRFPIRAGTRNVDMDYQQLFDSFALKSSVETRIDTWLAERSRHLASKAVVPVACLHILPSAAFYGAGRPDLSVLRNHMIRGSRSALSNRFNYGGMVSTHSRLGAKAERPYVQFFRSGIVEVVWDVSRHHDHESVLSQDTMIKLFDFLPQVANALELAGSGGPGYVSLSYVNVATRFLDFVHPDGYDAHTQPVEEDTLLIGPLPYENLNLSIEELGPLVLDIMTDLFRAFGEDGCPYMNSNGQITSKNISELVADYRKAWDSR